MKKNIAGVLVLFMATFTTHGGDAKKDLDLMQGTWLVESSIERGKKQPDDEIKILEVLIMKDILSVKERGKIVAEFQMKLDATKTPKSVDLVHTMGKGKGQAEIGIYAIEGETLRLCANEEGKDRPKEFASPEKSPFSLIVLKKMKK